MPYVNIKVTQEGGPNGSGPSSEEKAQLVSGVTELLQKVLNKNPATTFVVIDVVPLDNWGLHGKQVSHIRATTGSRPDQARNTTSFPGSIGAPSGAPIRRRCERLAFGWFLAEPRFCRQSLVSICVREHSFGGRQNIATEPAITLSLPLAKVTRYL